MSTSSPEGVQLLASAGPRYAEILSPDGARVRRRSAPPLRRPPARAAWPPASSGRSCSTPASTPDFLPETAAIRDGDWKVAPIPADLLDRRVEITGPVDRKMIVNALNSGAKVFMADFEDASSPVFANMIEGQANLKDLLGRHDRLHRRDDRQALRAEAQDRRADGAPARLAPQRAPSARRRRGDVGLAVRLRPLRLPLREGAAGGGLDAGLLSAQDGEPSRGAAVERRLRLSPRRRSASPTARSRRPC